MTDVPILNPQPVQMLDFSRQYAGIRQELLDAIESVCASQRFVLGPQVASFERAAAAASRKAAAHARNLRLTLLTRLSPALVRRAMGAWPDTPGTGWPIPRPITVSFRVWKSAAR